MVLRLTAMPVRPLHPLSVLTQVFDQPDESETGGLYFPMAMSNLCTPGTYFYLSYVTHVLVSPVVGLYIEQICLACLFFLKIKITHISSIVEGVLMLVLLVITFSAQTFVHNSFDRESS